MPETNCEGLKPGQACQYGNRFEILERRVETLEKGQHEEADFRKTYYQDREDRRVRDALLDNKIKQMDEKLDRLLNWKDEQLNRPNKLLDNIKDKTIGAIFGAVGAGIVAAVLYLISVLHK